MKQFEMNVDTTHSLIHLGSLDSFDITDGGKSAAKHVLQYLENGLENELIRAIEIYDSIIPNENFGGEYTALEWLCKYWLAPKSEQERFMSMPEIKGFYDLLCENDFYNLKWYMNRKYHFIEIDRKDLESKDQLRFLEDFILFANPDRERWEKIRENMYRLQIREGMSIADVGSGPGYYSFKFADIVGENGKVYAIETNPKHLDYLNKYIAENKITNVQPVTSSFEGIGLSPDIRVDVVFMCSLYHNVYAAFTDEERDSFVYSIRRALKPGGRLIIVDNDLVEDDELPYHGPFISKELMLSQLYYYGFDIVQRYQFTPQRYVLMLVKKEEVPQSNKKIHATFADEAQTKLRVTGTASLVRYRIIGTSTSGFTWDGKRLALDMYNALQNHDNDLLEKTAEGYENIKDKERIGDEYTALLWFCDMKLSSEEKRAEILSDPLIKKYYEFFSDNDFDRMKTYLRNKYNLKEPLSENRTVGTMETADPDIKFGELNEWMEYLTFNNPNRYMWEKTEEMLEYIGIGEGDYVADIGCGGGYFSWQFSKAVGENGKVFATEVNKDALKYVEELNESTKTQIIPTLAALNDTGLEENSVDKIFMCSMYHAVYIASIEFVKDAFIKSVIKALRPNGILYVVDNDITATDEPPYFGPGIVKELVIAQLSKYGFVLEEIKQFVPQRYVLKFRNIK